RGIGIPTLDEPHEPLCIDSPDAEFSVGTDRPSEPISIDQFGPLVLIVPLEGLPNTDDAATVRVNQDGVAEIRAALPIPGVASADEPLPFDRLLASLWRAGQHVVVGLDRLGIAEEAEECIFIDARQAISRNAARVNADSDHLPASIGEELLQKHPQVMDFML